MLKNAPLTLPHPVVAGVRMEMIDLSVNPDRITEIVSLILEEAKQRKNKVGLIADIYTVSMEIDHQIIEVMRKLKQDEKDKN